MPPPSPEVHTLVATAEGRLDRLLAELLPGISRSRLQGLIADGQVTVEGMVVRENRHKLKGGERISLAIPPPREADPEGEDIPLRILHEDEDVIVIDKPAGLVVHPGAGQETGTLVNALIAHCGDTLSGIGGVKRPGIVHRLDKDTSGVLVVAKNDLAHQGLSEQFQSHGRDGRLERSYQAIVWGVPERKSGTISAPIARSSANRQKMAVSRSESAREAITHYEVLESFGTPPIASLLRLRLETGRTHQIRVHLAHVGHPLLGDPTYGSGFKASAGKLEPPAREALKQLKRQALHASSLGFEHPRTGEALYFESPIPDDMVHLMGELRQNHSSNRKL